MMKCNITICNVKSKIWVITFMPQIVRSGHSNFSCCYLCTNSCNLYHHRLHPLFGVAALCEVIIADDAAQVPSIAMSFATRSKSSRSTFHRIYVTEYQCFSLGYGLPTSPDLISCITLRSDPYYQNFYCSSSD